MFANVVLDHERGEALLVPALPKLNQRSLVNIWEAFDKNQRRSYERLDELTDDTENVISADSDSSSSTSNTHELAVTPSTQQQRRRRKKPSSSSKAGKSTSRHRRGKSKPRPRKPRAEDEVSVPFPAQPVSSATATLPQAVERRRVHRALRKQRSKSCNLDIDNVGCGWVCGFVCCYEMSE
jgi:hypothetical protein